MKFSRYEARASSQAAQYDQGLRAYMLQIYNYMAAALVLTGVVALLAGSSPAIMSLFYVIEGGMIKGMSPLGWIVTLAPIGMVLALGFGMQRMRLQTVQLLFWSYAALMGLSLSSLFLVYTGASIARVFFITASVFGAMSLYGYTTKKDLTGMGSFLIMGLIGVIIASLVNMFLKSSGLQFALSILGTLIFVGLTAYDTQKIKHMYYEIGGLGEAASKIAIFGALTLYMDFINLFVHLLRFFGDRRE